MDAEAASVSESIQTLWTLICAGLVLFMQAGFCCLEAGAVRQKNSINVAVKNLVDLCVSLPAFFVLGYALMFGSDWFGLFGVAAPFLTGLDSSDLTSFLYQAAFCATAATIVSGAVAERCRFLPYLLVSAGTSLVIYPLFGHWVWGGGFLSELGFHDFAGSSVVHMVGAGVGLAGIQILGPRHGRFDAQGKASPIPGSSMPMVALGVMILLFGWIGFNGGSAPFGPGTSLILVNTLLAACFGGLGAMLLGWALRGMAQVELIFNGLLGGLVAVTACADVIDIHAAAGVGFLGGVSVWIGCWGLERLELDDAVGAVPVHGVAGVAGVVATGVLAQPALLEELGIRRIELVLVQILGAGVCMLWSYYAGRTLWLWVERVSDLRIGSVEERLGMNLSEHGLSVSSGEPMPAPAASVRNGGAHASH